MQIYAVLVGVIKRSGNAQIIASKLCHIGTDHHLATI